MRSPADAPKPANWSHHYRTSGSRPEALPTVILPGAMPSATLPEKEHVGEHVRKGHKPAALRVRGLAPRSSRPHLRLAQHDGGADIGRRGSDAARDDSRAHGKL
jgi:hypothetical protein